MKLSDYVIKYLEENGVKDVFLLAGGGIMHLLDSLAKNNNINKYYNLHEQASGFAADGYAQYSNKLGVVFATTGPGATNVITSLASAHIDSTPILVISGQVKRKSLTTVEGVRQTGAQEIGIVPIVKSITKYAVTVMEPENIKYEIGKAIYFATHGRPGAVWVDIPLDVQSADIQVDMLQEYVPASNSENVVVSDEDIDYIYNKLKNAKRPCIFGGTGIILSDAKREFVELVKQFNVPTVVSRRARRLFHKEDTDLFYGSAGGVATRYANYVLQNSDVLLVIGSGLRYYLTEFNEHNFAPYAEKIIVNIHEPEISKLEMKIEKSIVADAKTLITKLLEKNKLDPKMDWINYCNEMRCKYPAIKERIPHDDGLTDGYLVAQAIDKYAGINDIHVASPSAFAYGYTIYDLRANQDYICHVGLGSMGTALPCAIGACIASGKQRTIVGEGDGSLQHNIQELALLKEYNLPIKVFVDNNGGYRQIYTMQESHFNGRFAGCTPESGVGMPNLKKIAEAYGLKYLCVKNIKETDSIVRDAMGDDEPAIIEIISSPRTEFVPIVKSRIGKDGNMITSGLEDLYPFLSDAEQRENMIALRTE